MALITVLGWAVWRPRGWPEAVAAVPAAAIVIATGAISAQDAGAEARRLGPVIGFLAAVLVLAQLCDDEGLFRVCGAWLARTSGGRPRRLRTLVFAVASVITAVLSLDATVVLLTPVVFATAARLEVRAKPHVYACTHLSNSASLLLPVSNLTNLLAFSVSGLAPAWAALAGAVILGARALAQRRTSVTALATAADVPFLLFVLGLGIVVRAVTVNGLGRALGPLVPAGTSAPALLGIAALAAVLATSSTTCPPCSCCCRWPRRPGQAPSSRSCSGPTSART
jgi:Na+/H+ antiporter NhaD/arsenite permease-like protein